MIDKALELARAGIPVFPCAATKVPATPRGFKDASTDPDDVRALFVAYPGELIGACTGVASGFDVLDLDAKPEGKAWWTENRRRFPRTRIYRTRSGGFHLLFKHDDAVRCTAGRIARGVDTRADGGYVIWWPATGLPIASHAPPAPWPEWLLAELRPDPPAPWIDIAVVLAAKISGIGRREEAWAATALEGLASDLAGMAPGSRNHSLNAVAYRLGRMIARGWLDRTAVENVLIKCCIDNGLVADDGLPAVQATIRSGLRAGMAKPLPDLQERAAS